jgi:hypothetical protein
MNIGPWAWHLMIAVPSARRVESFARNDALAGSGGSRSGSLEPRYALHHRALESHQVRMHRQGQACRT